MPVEQCFHIYLISFRRQVKNTEKMSIWPSEFSMSNHWLISELWKEYWSVTAPRGTDLLHLAGQLEQLPGRVKPACSDMKQSFTGNWLMSYPCSIKDSFWLHCLKSCKKKKNTCCLQSHYAVCRKKTKKNHFISDPQANRREACKIIHMICSWFLENACCFVSVLGYSSVVMQSFFCSPQLEVGTPFPQRTLPSISVSTNVVSDVIHRGKRQVYKGC